MKLRAGPISVHFGVTISLEYILCCYFRSLCYLAMLEVLGILLMRAGSSWQTFDLFASHFMTVPACSLNELKHLPVYGFVKS